MHTTGYFPIWLAYQVPSSRLNYCLHTFLAMSNCGIPNCYGFSIDFLFGNFFELLETTDSEVQWGNYHYYHRQLRHQPQSERGQVILDELKSRSVLIPINIAKSSRLWQVDGDRFEPTENRIFPIAGLCNSLFVVFLYVFDQFSKCRFF